MHPTLSRRSLIAAAGAAGAFNLRPTLAADGPPEIARVQLIRDTTCGAPITIAEELIRAEGFTEVRYNEFEPGLTDIQYLFDGKADIVASFAADVIKELDAGTPITAVAGLHIGCQELFVHAPIASIKDLRGRRVALTQLDYGVHLTLSVMLAAVGLDPARDIVWVVPESTRPDAPGPRELFETGAVDAFFALPPNAQELRAKGVGQVILRTAIDRPWSQYYCCMLVVRRDFVSQYPNGTKRLLRALIKSTDFCAQNPDAAARQLLGRAPEIDYEMARAIMADVPYDFWRDYDPEDTLRYFGLRLRELDFISANPKDLLVAGADWRFLGEIRRELKA